MRAAADVPREWGSCMPALLDDFVQWNRRAAIVVPPKNAGHPGVHGIDVRFSSSCGPSFNGTVRDRFVDPFRSMEFFGNSSR
jgi:hypothetical protein